MKRIAILVLLIFVSLNIFPDGFRTLANNIVSIKNDTSVKTSIRLEQALIIKLPEDTDTLSGIEIKIEIPAILRNIQGLAAAIYNNINPNPKENIFTYTGNRLFFKLLPVGKYITITIPFENDQEGSKGLGIFPTAITEPQSFPAALVLYPATKGLPSGIDSMDFYVEIKPLLGDKGYLELNINGINPSEARQSSIEIDGKIIKYDKNPILMKEGLHSIKITGPSFSDIVKNFAIEKGKTTQLDIEINREYPTLYIQAPEIAMVLLDGKTVENFYQNLIPIKKGKHSIIVKLGDFSVSKEFEISENKTYSINLIMDIVIQGE